MTSHASTHATLPPRPGSIRALPAGCLAFSLAITALLATTPAQANFASGSTGIHGALDLTGESGVVELDPANLPNAPDDNVFHFVSITIPAGVTLKLPAPKLNMAPVYFLVQNDVSIDGTLDLSGETGHSLSASPQPPATPGPGGGYGSPGGINPLPGGGPWGGYDDYHKNGLNLSSGFLIPLQGGSGGRGQHVSTAASNRYGGGGGGGAILIAANGTITLNGSIDVRGGAAGYSNYAGTGAAGAVRLLAPTFAGSGVIEAGGHYQDTGGRVRIETLDNQFPVANIHTQKGLQRIVVLVPSVLILPPGGTPSVRVASVGGQAVSPRPAASIMSPDVQIGPNDIDADGWADIELWTDLIPLGTELTLHVFNQTEEVIVVTSDPIAIEQIEGQDRLVARAAVQFPYGISSVSIFATWDTP